MRYLDNLYPYWDKVRKAIAENDSELLLKVCETIPGIITKNPVFLSGFTGDERKAIELAYERDGRN